MRSLVYARDTLSGRTIQHFQARVLRSTARQGVGRGGALASLTFGKDDICILSMRYVGRINFKIFWGRMVQTHAYKLASPGARTQAPPFPPSPPLFQVKNRLHRPWAKF